jgi:hypothetical protein
MVYGLGFEVCGLEFGIWDFRGFRFSKFRTSTAADSAQYKFKAWGLRFRAFAPPQQQTVFKHIDSLPDFTRRK